MDKTRDAAAQVEKGMQFDRSLPASETCPRKELQTQVDGCRIERVNRFVEQRTQRFVRVECSSTADQNLREVGEDSPIVNAIGIRQGAAGNLAAKSRVVQFRTECAQASFDVPQAFAKRELRESQAQELIATGEAARAAVAVVPVDARVEFASRQEFHQLREHELSVEHKTPWARKTLPRQGSSVLANSDRVQTFCNAKDCEYRS